MKLAEMVHSSKTLAVTAICLFGFGAPSTYGQNLIMNGSFEQGPPFTAPWRPTNPGSTEFNGWTVTRGQIDGIESPRWTIPDGRQAIDLNGSPGVGGMLQVVATTPTHTYAVAFLLSANPEGGSAQRTLKVRAGTIESGSLVVARPANNASMVYSRRAWSFVANAASTPIEIYSTTTDSSAWGPVIDDVRMGECVAFLSSPASARICPNLSASFSAEAATDESIQYQWQIESPPLSGEWIPIADGLLAVPGAQDGQTVQVSGALSHRVTIGRTSNLSVSPLMRFRCVATTPSCSTHSGVYELRAVLLADLDDDGSFANGGTPDAAVTIDDLLFMLAAFEAGDLQADLDDDGEPGGGTPDGAVTIEDLLFFLARFEQGC